MEPMSTLREYDRLGKLKARRQIIFGITGTAIVAIGCIVVVTSDIQTETAAAFVGLTTAVLVAILIVVGGIYTARIERARRQLLSDTERSR
jgi:predicted transporter